MKKFVEVCIHDHTIIFRGGGNFRKWMIESLSLCVWVFEYISWEFWSDSLHVFMSCVSLESCMWGYIWLISIVNLFCLFWSMIMREWVMMCDHLWVYVRKNMSISQDWQTQYLRYFTYHWITDSKRKIMNRWPLKDWILTKKGEQFSRYPSDKSNIVDWPKNPSRKSDDYQDHTTKYDTSFIHISKKKNGIDGLPKIRSEPKLRCKPWPYITKKIQNAEQKPQQMEFQKSQAREPNHSANPKPLRAARNHVLCE